MLKPQSQMAGYMAAKSARGRAHTRPGARVQDGGVRVNAVAPGTMRTADNLAQMQAAGIRWIELEDLVKAVLYLASDDAKGSGRNPSRHGGDV